MTNKGLIAVVIIAVAVVILGVAGMAYAQSGVQPTQGNQPGYGRGMMGGRGGMMGGNYQNGVQATPGAQNGSGQGYGMMGGAYGLMHDEMVSALAAKLDMTVDELNARLAAGQTMWQVAQEKGITSDQYKQLMLDARNQALEKAVQNGTLTQAQADWMKQNMQNMPMFDDNFDFNDMPCNGAGGMMGRGGRFAPQAAPQSKS